MNQRVFNILISLIVFILIIIVCSNHNDTYSSSIEHHTIEIIQIEQQPKFLTSNNPEEYLIEALNYYNVQHPEIVYAQAILETGHFKSNVCKKYNNLFGLYDSKNKRYYKFDHWSDSIIGYLNYIQYKYTPPQDYYDFLEEIGYAEDPEYVNKLKRIVKQYSYEN